MLGNDYSPLSLTPYSDFIKVLEDDLLLTHIGDIVGEVTDNHPHFGFLFTGPDADSDSDVLVTVDDDKKHIVITPVFNHNLMSNDYLLMLSNVVSRGVRANAKELVEQRLVLVFSETYPGAGISAVALNSFNNNRPVTIGGEEYRYTVVYLLPPFMVERSLTPAEIFSEISIQREHITKPDVDWFEVREKAKKYRIGDV